MKLVLVLTCFAAMLLVPVIGFGQKTFVSIGPELALPESHKLPYNYKGVGFGGSVRLESFFNKQFSGIATAGYLSFAKTTPYLYEPNYNRQIDAFIIQVGVKFYLKPINENPTGFFFTGEAGLMPTSTHITYTNGSKQNRKENGLSVALGSGFQYKKIETSFRLQFNLSDNGYHVYYYNFRLAYALFNRKKMPA